MTATHDRASPRSLLKRLDMIKARPAVYLGVGPPNYGVMLERLDTWIVGYSEAIRLHQITDRGIEVYETFWQFLERKLRKNMSKGTIPTLRLISSTDKEAWTMYWLLLTEFRTTRAAG
jgi:hypothetical protein